MTTSIVGKLQLSTQLLENGAQSCYNHITIIQHRMNSKGILSSSTRVDIVCYLCLLLSGGAVSRLLADSADGDSAAKHSQ